MDFFNCCKSPESNLGYELVNRPKKSNQFVQHQNLNLHINNKSIAIKKIKKSQYYQLINQYKGTNKKWTDPEFPPNRQSLGQCEGVTQCKWKRISQICPKPLLFDGNIQPQDIVQGNLGDCYFLSALASLAEIPERIKEIFGYDQTTTNPNAIYRVTLLINGQIEQILVDDYIPVNGYDEPLFCQLRGEQFWVLILQKAWAKANGSYANIIAGLPEQVLRSGTHSPVKTFYTNTSKEMDQKIWFFLQRVTKLDFPACAGTIDDVETCKKIGLINSHAYTLLSAETVVDMKNQEYRIVTLRNPWGHKQWNGFASDNHPFWKTLSEQEKKKLGYEVKDDGIFHMSFLDFLKYFDMIDICYYSPDLSYFAEPIYAGKNASFFEFTVEPNELVLENFKLFENKSLSFFELHQPNLRGASKQRKAQGYSRATLIFAKKVGNTYQYIEGEMSNEEPDLSVGGPYVEGTYVLYCKFDPIKNNYPINTIFSSSTRTKLKLKRTTQKQHPQFLRKLFLNHARNLGQDEGKLMVNKNMWISKKIIYKDAGFAYIAFGNQLSSKKKFNVSFDESDFTNMKLKLKKPFKRRGKIQFEVLPGQEEIILCRFMNSPQTIKLNFPPPMNVQIQDI